MEGKSVEISVDERSRLKERQLGCCQAGRTLELFARGENDATVLCSRWGNCETFRLIIALAAFSAAVPISLARAAITPTGDVSPSNPGSWTTSTTGYIGNTASGTLTVNGSSHLTSGTGSIGNSSTGSGLVSVTGSGSTWASTYLYIGNSGSGSLAITSGGSVSDTNSYIGYGAGSQGTVVINGVGSKWTSTNLYVNNSGSGTVTITTAAPLASTPTALSAAVQEQQA